MASITWRTLVCIAIIAGFGGIAAPQKGHAGHGPPVPRPRADSFRPGYWQPGGYEGRIGSPYYYSYSAAPFAGRYRRAFPMPFVPVYGHAHSHNIDPYTYHFGPGFYRYGETGHFRFPYYNYRRPWSHPGPPVYVRDTNFPW